MKKKMLKFPETFKDENIVHPPVLFTVFSVVHILAVLGLPLFALYSHLVPFSQ